MKALMFAVIAKPTAHAVRHFHGMPPLADEQPDERHRMEPAKVIMATSGEAGFYLYRFDEMGDVVGDTWHPSVNDVKHQALVEYGLSAEDWRQMPDDLADFDAAIGYVMQQANKSPGS